MNRENAVKKDYKIMFEPPTLEFCIGEMRAIQEMLHQSPVAPFETIKTEMSVEAIDGLHGLLLHVSDMILDVAHKVSVQIDDAPEPESPQRKTAQGHETGQALTQPGS